MLTVIEHLSTIARVTEERRRAGHPMTFAAGKELLVHAVDLVRLADAVGDYLAGDITKAALMGAFRPMLESAGREAASA